MTAMRYAAGKDFEHAQKAIKLDGREEPLSFIVRGEELYFRGWTAVEPSFDHAPYDIEHIKQDEIDCRWGEGAACVQYLFRLANGFFSQQIHFEGLKCKRGNVLQKSAFEDRTYMDGVVVQKGCPVLEEREALLGKNFPCLSIGQFGLFGLLSSLKYFGMAPLAKALGSDLAGEYCCISFTTPANFFVSQLAFKLVRNIKADVRLSVEPFCFACTSIHTGVLCLITIGHWGIPFGLPE